MFRQYEDPHMLEERLEKARQDLARALQEDPDSDYIVYLYEDVATLEERVNFAWQDDEYDSNYDYDYEYMEV